MILKEYYELNNQVKIPKIGFGTWQIEEPDAPSAVKEAISCGYIHIDSAAAYGNEHGVGVGVRESGIKRENIFVTTKIPDNVKSYDLAVRQIEDSLEKLDLGYIDLMLIHSPKPWAELFDGKEYRYFDKNLEVWKAIKEYYDQGLIKSTGVSNFEICDIENLINNSDLKPQVNQIRVHIGHTPMEVIKYCQDNDILIEAFSPNACGRLLDHPELNDIAAKYGASITQLSIAYDLQLGLLPLPKTTHKEYMIENSNVGFSISPEDIEILKAVAEI